MKNNILSILACFALMLGVNACHSPEELDPTVVKNGINNFIASFCRR